MKSNDRAQSVSVVMAQKGQALPSSHGPLPVGSEALVFAPDKQEPGLTESQGSSRALEPVTVLTGEVLQRGRTRSEERSELFRTEDTAAAPDDPIGLEVSNYITGEDSDDGEVPEASQGNNFRRTAVLCIVVFWIGVVIAALAF